MTLMLDNPMTAAETTTSPRKNWKKEAELLEATLNKRDIEVQRLQAELERKTAENWNLNVDLEKLVDAASSGNNAEKLQAACEIIRWHRYEAPTNGGKSRLLGFFDFVWCGLTCTGNRLMETISDEGQTRIWISFPSHEGKQEKFYRYFFFDENNDENYCTVLNAVKEASR